MPLVVHCRWAWSSLPPVMVFAVALAAAAAQSAPAVPATPATTHWAFRPPERHVPAVQDPNWCRDDLDRCVLAGLEASQRRPSPPAEPTLLLRRLHLVLAGLPPTPEQVAAFLADPSEAAYDHVVDTLLADDASAEHLASDWLDLARFADTHGYQADFECRTWPWRDWLLQALAADLPWDRFVQQIVAGDLLPEATVATRTATAFWRLHRQTNEGGSIDEEWRQEYLADRVDTLGTAFLGLTLGCARCHDHKSDPISIADYYALGSFFQIDEAGLYPYSTGVVPQPAVRLSTPAQAATTARLQAEVDAAREVVAAAREQARSSQPNPVVAAPASVAHRDFGATGQPCDGDARLPIPGLPTFTRDDAFSVRLELWCPDHPQRAVLLHTSHYTQDADTQGYQLLVKDGRLCWELVHHWPGSAAAVRMVDPLPLQRRLDLVATYDGSSTARGLTLYVDGEPVAVEIVRDHLAGPATVRQLELGGRDRDRGFTGGRWFGFALYDQALTAAEVAVLAGKAPTREAVLAHGVCRHPAVLAAGERLAAARRALHQQQEAIPELMVMAPFAAAPPRFVLQRGAYDQPDRKRPTPAGVPAFLPPLPVRAQAAGPDRLDLAAWLLDPRHPLPARVVVDRLWAQCFGRGLVATPENFGHSGVPPVQQPLLDLLAVDFGHDRSLKRLLRRIVRSATFRQSSVATPAQREADPNNEWLARGPSFRLSAEVLRDQALAASGLLHRQLGGPSVKPWQPPGLWQDAGVGWGGSDYTPDTGPAAHRRSLYTYRKRTAPPPNLTTFDGQSRETCVARRQVTDTPLQALVLLGDPVFTECAAALAARALALPAADHDARLRFCFTSLCARAPRAAELAALRALHDSLAADATQALTLVASTVMASDAAVVLR
jgi:hypothetical protein